ncbi:hypothetical protein [Sphingomonas pruni]|uniref:hypothetical protein n=1 Tax=Sphingomonas pruni TaxID=40683 RepID=UPI00082E211C|nr:hypothetical protein [Sphingomonas pruni]
MIELNQLEFAAPSSAQPGSLLIHAAMSPNYTALLTIGGGGPRNALTIDGGERGFRVVNAQGAHGPYLRIANPRFVIDPASALNGFDSQPEAGTLFLTPQGPGILAIADHSEVGVMLDGTLLDNVDYASFAGFRHWRIEVGDPIDEPHMLFTYRRDSLDQGA